MKMIKSFVASDKVNIAFLKSLQIVKIRDSRKVTKITKRRKMSFLLNKCLNI